MVRLIDILACTFIYLISNDWAPSFVIHVFTNGKTEGCGSYLDRKHGRQTSLKPMWTSKFICRPVLHHSPYTLSLTNLRGHFSVLKRQKVFVFGFRCRFGFAFFASMASTCCLWVSGERGALPRDPPPLTDSSGCFWKENRKREREKKNDLLHGFRPSKAQWHPNYQSLIQQPVKSMNWLVHIRPTLSTETSLYSD